MELDGPNQIVREGNPFDWTGVLGLSGQGTTENKEVCATLVPVWGTVAGRPGLRSGT